ncbi:MAG TPA: TIGR03619 family F420-dependent LLM class oxidoreductase [bacterium]|nr:TIGR03619 family F420-dependent LLM class oxidoreductase [bacterium]
MEFSVRLPTSNSVANVENIVRVAQEAERLGFEGVSVHDHLAFAGDWVACGSVEAIDGEREKNFFEALNVLSYVAALTEKVKLQTGILVLPIRNPLHIAKGTATVDVLSRGRLILGVGLGAPYSRQGKKEFESLKVPGRERGLLADEYLEVIRELWTKPKASYKGRTVEFTDVEMYPKPVQKPHPPIWIGGTSMKAVNRAARVGNGWLPSGATVEEVQRGVSAIPGLLIEHGREGSRLTAALNVFTVLGKDYDDAWAMAEKTLFSLANRFQSIQDGLNRTLIGSPTDMIQRIREYQEAGLQHIEMKMLYPNIESLLEMMRRFCGEVRPAFN